MTAKDRKAHFKMPPPAMSSVSLSQEARRLKALEEQKRRRALRIDSARQLDRFAGLHLSDSAEEQQEDEDDRGRRTVLDGIAPYASLLEPSAAAAPEPASSMSGEDHPLPMDEAQPTKKRKKRKPRPKSSSVSSPHPSKWADQCMYAELLEMPPDPTWRCGLPDDLESGWVAVGPVPAGKRCLAVTHQASGIQGIVPNTTLHSRLLGKSLIRPFPSPLPPSTVLDCILDPNWRDNGILHVLDCIKWKGQDIGDCETPFRLWWRDTRLSELPSFPAPTRSARPFPSLSAAAAAAPASISAPSFLPTPQSSQLSIDQPARYQFPYPTALLPIPYHPPPLALHLLSSRVIPSARAGREARVEVPAMRSDGEPSSGMEVDAHGPGHATATHTAHIASDGLLLYVAKAAYEHGASPLSCWIPLSNADEDPGDGSESGGRLDLFERLVRRRCALASNGSEAGESIMDVGA